jgi:L-fucose mutarotase/ribose pyranase (RbsD/FucU family)
LLPTSRKVFIIAAVSIASVVATAQASRNGESDWRARVRQELPLMGHRNWIAVVDSAYPLQTSGGIETIETGADQIEVVQAVLEAIRKSRHVRPVIFTDAELTAVLEGDARGVTAYRESLTQLLGRINGEKLDAQALPHEQIISKLDDAGKTFHILVLKSTMTIPYTSVFIRLDCGYWTEEQEKRLRERMGKK